MQDKGIKVRGVALRGDPREEIVHKVEDVLVIGSRGMGAVKRTIIGSVSDYCVHHCHTTVIVPRK
jgi:nucleotide-binding universal stress UspA family protein